MCRTDRPAEKPQVNDWAIGCCNNSTFEYKKTGGAVAEVNCAALGSQNTPPTTSCEWVAGENSYACSSPADGTGVFDSDPSGVNPRNCPGAPSACIVDCAGKQCGNDGCGGSCGVCPAGDTCIGSVGFCVSDTASSCGNIITTSASCCSGNVLVQCQNEGSGFQLDSVNCDWTPGNNVCLQTSTTPGASGCYQPGTAGTSTPPACPSVCTPQCTGKDCGPDGCGGSCGTCGSGLACSSAGECGCAPQCKSLANNGAPPCGPDGCGGSCGTCGTGNYCLTSGLNAGLCECQQQCSGKQCGPDSCGGSCGSCASNASCNALGQCLCDPACTGVVCGPDGCGGSCGTCGSGLECNSGQCCTPQCTGRNCGPDGCGGVCGSCAYPQVCGTDNTCSCTPQCTNAQTGARIACGQDGCGGECGTCQFGSCVAGQCECTPNCLGKTCGPDGCGGSCGSCPGGSNDTCTGAGQCVCTPNCTGLACGANGCGGNCGFCGTGQECDNGLCCIPQCDGKNCGSDGCGGTCGTCGSNGQCDTGGVCTYDACPTVPERNCCVPGSNTVEVCSAGNKAFQSCYELGSQYGCAWDTNEGEYDCVNYDQYPNAGPEPTGRSTQNCAVCVPQCDGKNCGPDGCGGSCGACTAANSVCDTGVGVCTFECPGLPAANCCSGSEFISCDSTTGQLAIQNCAGWGGNCGWNGSSYACSTRAASDPSGTNARACPSSVCIPNCNEKNCGSDGCGGSCGVCSSSLVCNDSIGVCVPPCKPQCTGKVCGPDGCGGTCGSQCAWDQYCSPAGQCTASDVCEGVPESTGCCEGTTLHQCLDPSGLATTNCSTTGQFCGWDSANGVYDCNATGGAAPDGGPSFECPGAPACVRQCTGKTCGPDSCGGTCGACGGNTPTCDQATGQCVPTPCGGIPLGGCCDPQEPGILLSCPSVTSTNYRATQCATWSGQQCGWSNHSQSFVCTSSPDPTPAGATAACPAICGCVDSSGYKLDCGTDPCGNYCGSCGNGQECEFDGPKAFIGSVTAATTAGTCCKPNCAANSCAPDDGCGGSCGPCSGALVCDPYTLTCLQAGAGICGDVTTAGSCNGNTITYCSETGVLTESCVSGDRCGYGLDGGVGMNTCYNPTPPACTSGTCDLLQSAGCNTACVQGGSGYAPGELCYSNFDSACGTAITMFGSCGDMQCQPLQGETCETCPADCGACPAAAPLGNSPPWDVPFTQTLADPGQRDQHAEYVIVPSDDIRPEGPPYPIDGLQAYIPQLGLNAGFPRTSVLPQGANPSLAIGTYYATGFTWSGKVEGIDGGLSGPALSFTASEPGDGGEPLSSNGVLKILPPTALPWAGSYAHNTAGGMTLAMWLRVPQGSFNQENPIASGRTAGGVVCGWSRPADSVVQLTCPSGTSFVTGGPEPEAMTAIESYFGEVVTTPFGAGNISGHPFPDGTCATYQAMEETGRCSSTVVQALAQANCIGQSTCTVNALDAGPDPCLTASPSQYSTLMMRAVCEDLKSGFGEFPPTLFIDTAANNQLLHLNIQGLNDVVSISSVQADTWTHIAFTFEPGSGPQGSQDAGRLTGKQGTLTLYVNGVQEAHAQNFTLPPEDEWDLGTGFINNALSSWSNRITNDAVHNVAMVGDVDDVFLYDRPLSGTEISTIMNKPTNGPLRVWPQVDATRTVVNGPFNGVMATLSPVQTPQLLDPVATQAQGSDVLLSADWSGLHFISGQGFFANDTDQSLGNLSTFTLAGWVKVAGLTAGAPVLELEQGGTPQLTLQISNSCGNAAVTAVEGSQSALPISDCQHGLAAGQWHFVAYVQEGTSQSVYVDGHLNASGSGGVTLFTGTASAGRGLVGGASTDGGTGVDLGWAALYNQALYPSQLETIRSTGPAVWLEGKAWAIDGGAAPIDFAGFHNDGDGGVAQDEPRLWLPGGAPATATSADLTTGGAYATVPARGRLSFANGFTWSGRVSLPLPPQNVTIPLLTLEDDGSTLMTGALNCTGTATSPYGCYVSVSGIGSLGTYYKWETTTLEVTATHDLEARVAIAYNQQPVVALYFTSEGGTVQTSGAQGSDGGTSSAGSSVLPPVQQVSTGGQPAAQAPAASITGAQFILPGEHGASNSDLAVSDVRLYTRALSAGELAADVWKGCAAATCGAQNRVCSSDYLTTSTGSPFGDSVDFSTCGGCTAEYGEANGECVALPGFNQPCTSQTTVIYNVAGEPLEILSSNCNNPDLGCSSKGLCVYTIETADCDTVCARQGEYCDEGVNLPYLDSLGNEIASLAWGCDNYSSGCLPNYAPQTDGTCTWTPTIPPGGLCSIDSDCTTGACAPVTEVQYGVSQPPLLSLNAGGAYDPEDNPMCTDAGSCAIPQAVSTQTLRCAVTDPEICVNAGETYQPYTPTGLPYAGALAPADGGSTYTAYACATSPCASGYQLAYNMLSPEGCHTMWQNAFNLVSEGQYIPGKSGQWFPPFIFTGDPDAGTFPGVPSPPLYSEPSMQGLVKLLDPDGGVVYDGGVVPPQTYASLKAAGAGPVLLAWAQGRLSEDEQQQYSVGGANGAPSTLYLSDCNNYDVKHPFTDNDFEGHISPFFDPDLNGPICVPKTYPNGTPCPAPIVPALCRANAGNTCQSGFCAADTQVCETGYGGEFSDPQGTDRNDSHGGGNDLGGIQLIQGNDSDVDFSQDTTDGGNSGQRQYSLNLNVSNSVDVFGLVTVQITDMSVSVSAQMGAETGQFAQTAELFGVSIPISDQQSLASCGGPEWDPNGGWQNSGCASVRDPLTNLLNPSKVSTVQINLPVPQICHDTVQDTSELDEPPTGLQKFCFKKTLFDGPVPITVTAGPELGASISFGAEIDSSTMDPEFVVTPDLSLGLVVTGAVGVSEGLTLEAGVKANIDIFDLSFPISWEVDVSQASDSSGNPVSDLWILTYTRTVDVQLTFLEMQLQLFFAVGVGSFGVEWDYDLLGFGGIQLQWNISTDTPLNVKDDFDYDPNANCGSLAGTPAGAE